MISKVRQQPILPTFLIWRIFVICKDRDANNKLVEIRFESEGSYEEFFSLFKRFNVILTDHGAYGDCEIDSEWVYVDDRQ